MPYLISQGSMFVAVTKPFRVSKRATSAKSWATKDLAERALHKLKEQGQDITGMVVRSLEENHTVLSPRDYDTLVENCNNPPPLTEAMKEAVKTYVAKKPVQLFEIVEEEKPQTAAEVKAAFSGINPKCISCSKDCKQKFKDKIVHCPIYKETTRNV